MSETSTSPPPLDDGLVQFRMKKAEADLLQVLVDSGVFAVKNGQAILSFNQDGTMMTIEIRTNAYRRRSTGP